MEEKTYYVISAPRPNSIPLEVMDKFQLDQVVYFMLTCITPEDRARLEKQLEGFLLTRIAYRDSRHEMYVCLYLDDMNPEENMATYFVLVQDCLGENYFINPKIVSNQLPKLPIGV